MKIIKIEGIIVGEQNYGESSKILKVFTKDLGIVSVISKGSRKIKSPLRSISNKLIYASFDISYKENGLSTLVSGDIIDLFKNIIIDYKDLEKKLYAFTIVDLTLQVINQKHIEKEEINEVYDILIASIKKINEGLNARIILDIVMLKYLKYLGVMPNIDSCSLCGSVENIITMDSKSFGFICKECYQDEVIVNEKALKLVRMLYYIDIPRIKNLDVKEEIEDVRKFIDAYYEEHTGIYFNIKKKIISLNKIGGII